jgi:Glyoxalase/Bleomycin resistance protein/Dioxygenase superfamily
MRGAAESRLIHRQPSAGIVHHVACSTTDAEQGRWIERLDRAGIPHSRIIDRHYFHSVHFREPGGVRRPGACRGQRA